MLQLEGVCLYTAGFQQKKSTRFQSVEGTSKGKAGFSFQITKDGIKDQNWGKQSGDLVTLPVRA